MYVCAGTFAWLQHIAGISLCIPVTLTLGRIFGMDLNCGGNFEFDEMGGLQKLQVQSASLVAIGTNPLDVSLAASSSSHHPHRPPGTGQFMPPRPQPGPESEPHAQGPARARSVSESRHCPPPPGLLQSRLRCDRDNDQDVG